MVDKKVLWMLGELRGFEKPKIKLEQYATSAEIAVSMMEFIEDQVGFDNATVADLGCGCGMLMTTIAACYEPATVIGVDIDDDALKICSENLSIAEVHETCELIKTDALTVSDVLKPIFDIVVINPPFGTKNNEGIDMKFVRAGLSITKPGGSVYSLHKSSTRKFILQTGRNWENVESAECCAEMVWNLPATYKFHKSKAVDIQVDLIRFIKK
ncbi:unnamed protein product [Caenorhabditis bovis]|uniref:Methyltransferase-like protein 5 n=1 Tax=Caenorhabditis bovis TaxID=2654633 RepID=A0A8S1ET29_9PELO|nr:unnamed protein product [Caenorhabditis bovis]